MRHKIHKRNAAVDFTLVIHDGVHLTKTMEVVSLEQSSAPENKWQPYNTQYANTPSRYTDCMTHGQLSWGLKAQPVPQHTPLSSGCTVAPSNNHTEMGGGPLMVAVSCTVHSHHDAMVGRKLPWNRYGKLRGN